MDDVFISHASEDKGLVVEPLAQELIKRGYSVWYDRMKLRLGDSLPKKIDEGLNGCRYAVVVLSRAFMTKPWPQRELDGLVARETTDGSKRILPVWHQVKAEDVANFSATLSSRLAVSTDRGLGPVVEAIVEVLGPPSTAKAVESNAPIPIEDDSARLLASAVDRAREYLRPNQPLKDSDSIAELVRHSFNASSVVVTLVHIGPYLSSHEAAYRVVGYFAAQAAVGNTSEVSAWAIELADAFEREQKEAQERNETRPMWQLLVATTKLLERNPQGQDRIYLREAMDHMQGFLSKNGHIDPGGECKWLLGQLQSRIGA